VITKQFYNCQAGYAAKKFCSLAYVFAAVVYSRNNGDTDLDGLIMQAELPQVVEDPLIQNAGISCMHFGIHMLQVIKEQIRVIEN